MLNGHNTPLKHFHFYFHAVAHELIPQMPLKPCQHLDFRKINWTKIVRYFQCAPRWEIDSDSDNADAYTRKRGDAGDIITANFLDFPPNFRLRTRF